MGALYGSAEVVGLLNL